MNDQEIMDRFVDDAKRIIELKDRVREREAELQDLREALADIIGNAEAEAQANPAILLPEYRKGATVRVALMYRDKINNP